MRYNNFFILIASISAILGILFAILIDDSDINIIFDINNLKNSKVPKKIFGEANGENKNDRKSIPIAISIDNKYTFPGLVFITSLMENIGPKTKYEIYIMSPYELPENTQNKFSSLIKKYGKEKLKITLINMENNFVPSIKHLYISKTAYYRIYLPLLLPEVDKLIYSDVDVINLKDLSELYNMKFEKDIFLYGMIDYNYYYNKKFKIFDITFDKWVNSGVLLMDLKNIREKGYDIKLVEFMIKNRKKLIQHDQTVINVVFYKNIGLLPLKYVIFSFENFREFIIFNREQNINYRRSKDELGEAYIHPFLVHFAGEKKPWYGGGYAFQEYWWYYAKKTDYYNEILQYYKNLKRKKKKILF